MSSACRELRHEGICNRGAVHCVESGIQAWRRVMKRSFAFNRSWWGFSLLLILGLMWLVALAALPFAPASVATHWDIHGTANGQMGRVPGLLLMPLIAT